MQIDKAIIATITWARTADEEQRLKACLSVLSGLGPPVVVADGGSGPAFMAFLRSLPNVTIVAPERPGLVGQVLASLNGALARDPSFIVYTESDKQRFFERHLRDFIEGTPEDAEIGTAIAARDAASFATFPETQRSTEGAINRLFAREIGLSADFCYGPLIINPALVPSLSGLDAGLGWGWRFYLMGRARRAGYAVHVHEAHLPCPPDQREDDLAERVHRLRQLSQNLQGVVLALQEPAAGS
jgi:hypothetical protein